LIIPIAYSISSDNYNHTIYILPGIETTNSSNYENKVLIENQPVGNISSSNYQNKVGYVFLLGTSSATPESTVKILTEESCRPLYSQVINEERKRSHTCIVSTTYFGTGNYTIKYIVPTTRYVDYATRTSDSFTINATFITKEIERNSSHLNMSTKLTITTSGKRYYAITYTWYNPTISIHGGLSGGSGSGYTPDDETPIIPSNETICNETQFNLNGRCLDLSLKPLVDWWNETIFDMWIEKRGVLEYSLRPKDDKIQAGKKLILTNWMRLEQGEEAQFNCTNFIDINRNGVLDMDSEDFVMFSKMIRKGEDPQPYQTEIKINKKLIPNNYMFGGICKHISGRIPAETSFYIVEVTAYEGNFLTNNWKTISYWIIGSLIAVFIILYFNNRDAEDEIDEIKEEIKSNSTVKAQQPVEQGAEEDPMNHKKIQGRV